MSRAAADPDLAIAADNRAARAVAVVAAVLGLAASVYLTVEHYSGSQSFACPDSSTVNCLKVTTSKWSTIIGIPVALLGLIYFVVMVGVVLVPLTDHRLRMLRIAASAVGVLSALYLVYIELFEVDAICLWCTAVHVCALVLFGATIWRDSSR